MIVFRKASYDPLERSKKEQYNSEASILSMFNDNLPSYLSGIYDIKYFF